jgi:hypothetical protein
MRSLSLMSSRTVPCALASSSAGAGGRSETRGWRCPTGAGKGDTRTASGPGGATAALSDGAFWAQAVPHIRAMANPGAGRKAPRNLPTIDSRWKSSNWREMIAVKKAGHHRHFVSRRDSDPSRVPQPPQSIRKHDPEAPHFWPHVPLAQAISMPWCAVFDLQASETENSP